MKVFDARDQGNAAYINVLTNSMTRSEAIAKFNLDKLMGSDDPMNRNTTKGSQNYDITARAIADDWRWFKRLHTCYKIKGLHSKEWGPVYLKHHILAWGMMAAHGMPEANEVLRSTWAVLALLSWPSPPGNWGTAGSETKSGPWKHAYDGPVILPIGERTTNGSYYGGKAENGPFHGCNELFAQALGLSVNGVGDARKPWPIEMPRGGTIKLSNGRQVAVASLNLGQWWLRVKDHPAQFTYGLSEGDQELLDRLVWDAGYLSARELITFPYAGHMGGTLTPIRTTAYSAVQLNGNKPPIEAATVDANVMTVIRTADYKWSGAASKATEVYAGGPDGVTVVTDGGSFRLDGYGKDEFPAFEWIWNRNGFSARDVGSSPGLPVTVVPPRNSIFAGGRKLPEKKKGIFGKALSWIKDIFG